MDTKQEEKEWKICRFLCENPMIYFSLTALIYGYICYELYKKFSTFIFFDIWDFLSAYKEQLIIYIVIGIAWEFVTQGCGKIKKNMLEKSQEQREDVRQIFQKIENVCGIVWGIVLIWVAISVYIRIGEFNFYLTLAAERGLLLIEGASIIIGSYEEYICGKKVQEEDSG